MTAKKSTKQRVEVKNVTVAITIEAEYEINDSTSWSDIDDSIERGLTELRELGSAEVKKRKITGEMA